LGRKELRFQKKVPSLLCNCKNAMFRDVCEICFVVKFMVSVQVFTNQDRLVLVALRSEGRPSEAARSGKGDKSKAHEARNETPALLFLACRNNGCAFQERSRAGECKA